MIGRRSILAAACGAVGASVVGCGDAPVPPKLRARLAAQPRDPSRGAPPFAPSRLRVVRDRLAAETPRAPRPAPGDWLYDHPETGQTFEEYLTSHPTFPSSGRRTLAILPLGDLPPERAEIVTLATEYLGRHFGLPVRKLEPLPLPLSSVPESAKRAKFGTTQLLTKWILDSVLKHRVPSDAAALLAFTASDLWPGENWNYVFGEATFDERVGVWSLHRNGDPSASPEAFALALDRALKTAVHETGHMFSLPHCTRYACVQAGVNSLEEGDKAPLWLCPECLPKVAWITSTDPRARIQETLEFCRKHRLPAKEHLAKALEVIG
jgi:archaemetzincin